MRISIFFDYHIKNIKMMEITTKELSITHLVTCRLSQGQMLRANIDQFGSNSELKYIKRNVVIIPAW